MPVRTAAILCKGLPEESRIMMKLSGSKASCNTLLTAAIYDQLNLIRWLHTDDASKGKNRPASLVAEITGKKEDENILAFASGEDFMKAREAALKQWQH